MSDVSHLSARFASAAPRHADMISLLKHSNLARLLGLVIQLNILSSRPVVIPLTDSGVALPMHRPSL